jgi:hypothetical protein
VAKLPGGMGDRDYLPSSHREPLFPSSKRINYREPCTFARPPESEAAMSSSGNVVSSQKVYTSRIIKAGALLTDTKTLLRQWNDTQSVPENLDRIRRANIFGKASRSRVEDILTIFRQRYLMSEEVTRSLVILVRRNFPDESLKRALYFFAAQADTLLHDVVTELLPILRAQGKTDIHPMSIRAVLIEWMNEGRMTGRWSDTTLERTTRELLATLRDFGILQGGAKKRLAPLYLPREAFAYIAFYLQQRQPSGERLLNDPEWQLFFLSAQMVERCFLEAHQWHLLEYHAAGSIIRITFPATSLEEYAYALTQRAY